MNPHVIVIFIVLLMSSLAKGQEQLGMRTSNYAGVNGLTLNPASSLTNPFSWDVNLLEVGMFFDNNYLFLENFRLTDAFNGPSQLVLRPELETHDLPTPTDKLVLDFYHNKKRPNFTYHADILIQAMGPSLMIRLTKTDVAAVYLRTRGAFNARKLPGVLGYYEFTDQLYNTSFVVKPFKVDGMAWTEVGLNYAHASRTRQGEISFGGTLKVLQGFEVGYGSMEQSMRFIEIPGNRLLGAEGSTKHSFTIPTVEGNTLKLEQKGSGVAFDFGVTFTIDGDKGKFRTKTNYRHKIGISLLDVGAIRFTKSTENHMVNVTDSTSLYFDEFTQFNSINQLDSIARLFSQQTMKNPYASFQGNAFTMWLPSALSVQAEVAISPAIFLNATLVQGFPLIKNTLRRGAVLGFTPRFESRWLEVALPITVFNWQHLRSGLTVRLGMLWVGTEDFGSLVKKANFDSTDIYFALKFNPFQLPFGKKGSKSGIGCPGPKQFKGRRKRDCPTF